MSLNVKWHTVGNITLLTPYLLYKKGNKQEGGGKERKSAD